MKKLYFFLLLFCSIGFSQGITVSSTNYTLDQLVNDVLISNNCNSATNIQSQANCGIGYFNKNGSSFPFQEGVIIRSGNVENTQGTYSSPVNPQQNSCDNQFDQDLANLTNNPINDATWLSFDFISSSNSLDFDFIFASNEYGPYACSAYNDYIIFLLTDLTTGTTQNIALVPGTNYPVCVNNIRPNSLNCIGSNAAFFDQYYSSNPNHPINLRGYTHPMTASSTIIPNNPYRLKIGVADSGDISNDSAVFIEGSSFNSTFNSNCIADLIKVEAFFDSNLNGMKDIGEPIFTQGNFVHSLNGNTPNYLSSYNGINYISNQSYTDTNTISYEINSSYSSYFTSSYVITNFQITQGSGINTISIPITSTTPIADIAVSTSAIFGPKAGFTHKEIITYRNNGNVTLDGTLNYTINSNATIVSVSEPNATFNTNGFTFNYANLLGQESRTIEVLLSVPPIPTVNIGDYTTSTINCTANTTEINTTNNQFILNALVVVSYDPNDVTEIHNGLINLDQTPNDYLYYTIRFQNTGTANTQFVTVKQSLDALLDFNTFEMINSSHSYSLKRTTLGELEWTFDPIQLTPKMVNEENSQGYITYRVKPLYASITPVTYTNAQAEIYFDYNPPIITNTHTTTFTNNLGTSTFDLSELSIYPNPFQEVLNIQSGKNDTILNIKLFDLTGKIIVNQKINNNNYQLNTTNFTSGIYLLEIESPNDVILKKIIKQ
jgi:hypothetical protein